MDAPGAASGANGGGSGRHTVIAGGSGFLGLSLAAHLAALGRSVVILSRSAPAARPGGWRHVGWDGRTIGPWVSALEGASGLVNLAGRTVDCLKSPEHCDEILRSRVEATRVLGEACRAVKVPPPVWVQMGTAHIYGDPPEVVCDEGSAFGYGLAPTVGKAWEDAFAAAVLPSQRGVVLRTSFVIGRANAAGGGALGTLAKLARLGLGGTVGHGRQGMSWIHGVDMDRLFERALDDETMRGAYIATAPNPVSNRDFMRELRKAVGMPIGLPAPAFGVRVVAPLLMRKDPELALYGRFVVSRRLKEEGFAFRFPEVGAALADLCARR